MDLKAPDARVYGFLAWGRYSAIVPNDMYQTLDPATQGIGTGPFKLERLATSRTTTSTTSRTRTSGSRACRTWTRSTTRSSPTSSRASRRCKRRLDRRRVVSADSAAPLNGYPGLTVLHNLTAAFRELQFTIKAGENKPWADKRVRQAVNHAINRQNLIDKVYAGYGQYSGHVAAGYGPWQIPSDRAASRTTRSTTCRWRRS